ncbi:MAG: hypothetical protein ACKV2Q_34330, partial [Planctomycetaceae bacterium]
EFQKSPMKAWEVGKLLAAISEIRTPDPALCLATILRICRNRGKIWEGRPFTSRRGFQISNCKLQIADCK